MRKRISELQPGDLVNLEGDHYADNGEHPEFEFEYAEVGEIELETPTCTVIHFDKISCGFPPNHVVEVMRREKEA